MTTRELVVIGASAGGLEALLSLIVELPRNLPAAVIVAIHTRSDSSGFLPSILARRARLPVEFAKNRAAIRAGRIYVAPADFHVQVVQGRIHLSRGPKENGFRPAIDPLFRSASRAKGKAVIGVVLSGGLDDGTHGLQTIKDAGGVTVVQDPDEAIVAGMPQSAIRHVNPDYVLSASAIGKLITKLSGTPAEGQTRMAKRTDPEPQDPADTTEVLDMQETYGPPTGLTCPDCGGALWEIKDGQILRYRCHVGHQFSEHALDVEQHDAVESALWSAVRVLEEHAELRRRMAARASEAGLPNVSRGFENSSQDSQRQAAEIRALLFARTTPEPARRAHTGASARSARKSKTRPSSAPSKRTARKRASLA
jgi:two-component system chemotaxis response regulator CheB